MTDEESEKHKENIAKITSLSNKILELICNEKTDWQTAWISLVSTTAIFVKDQDLSKEQQKELMEDTIGMIRKSYGYDPRDEKDDRGRDRRT